MGVLCRLDLLDARALPSVPLVEDLSSIKDEDIARVDLVLGHFAYDD